MPHSHSGSLLQLAWASRGGPLLALVGLVAATAPAKIARVGRALLKKLECQTDLGTDRAHPHCSAKVARPHQPNKNVVASHQPICCIHSHIHWYRVSQSAAINSLFRILIYSENSANKIADHQFEVATTSTKKPPARFFEDIISKPAPLTRARTLSS